MTTPPMVGGIAGILTLMLTLAGATPALAAPLQRPVEQLGTRRAAGDPCMRPTLIEGRGGGAGETIQQLTPETSSALLLQLFGHAAEVRQVAFSHDGEAIFTMGFDGVYVWDSFSGEDYMFLDGATNAALGPGGDALAAIYDDNTFSTDDQAELSLLDANGEQYRKPLPVGFNAFQMAFTPDGKQILLVSNFVNEFTERDSEIIVWDVAQGQVTKRLDGVRTELPISDDRAARWKDYAVDGIVSAVPGGHAGYISDFAISPDGKSVATASDDGTVRIWNLQTGKAAVCIEASPFQGDSRVLTVAFSPDGKEVGTVALVYPATGSAHVYQYARWRSDNGAQIAETALDLGADDYVGSNGLFGGESDLNQDMSRWVVPNEQAVLLWDTATGDMAGAVRQPGDAFWADYSPDGSAFAASYNYANDIGEPAYGALVWDATSPELAAGAQTEKLVQQAADLLHSDDKSGAQRLLRQAAVVNPFPWYDPAADAAVRAGLAEPDNGSLPGIVTPGRDLFLRSRPSLLARRVTRLSAGTELDVFARTPNSQWLYVAYPAEMGYALAWAQALYVDVDGEVEDLPVKQ